jgi:hypothetical protein
MTPPRSFDVFAIAFSVVFAVVYVIAVENNYALFTYHPAVGEFGGGVQAGKGRPCHVLVRLVGDRGITASVAGVLASLLPEDAYAQAVGRLGLGRRGWRDGRLLLPAQKLLLR